jgi:hypothetical protein
LIIKEPPIYHTGLEESEAVPEEYALIGNYPNPFNPNTVIVYHLAEQAKVSIEVYDMRGHLVKVLCSEMKKAGAHKAEWDATDITGQKVMTGVYLSRMKSG